MINAGKPGDTYVIKQLCQSSHCNTICTYPGCKEITLLIAEVPLLVESVFLDVPLYLVICAVINMHCMFVYVNRVLKQRI